MAVSKATSKRRTREEKESQLETLLNSLSVDQLRTAYFQLNKKLPKKCRSHNDYVDAINKSGKTEKEMLSACYLVESESPHKHFYITKCTGILPNTVRVKKLQSEKIKYLKGLKLTYSNQRDEYIHITLDQPVRVVEWSQIDGDTKKRKTRTLRHPIFVRFYQAKQVLYISYPGFSQGLATKKIDRINYETVISEVLASLSEEFQWTYENFAFRSSIDLLLDMNSKRVSRIKATPKKGDGRLTITTNTGGVSTEKWLATLIASQSNKEVKDLEKSIKEAFKASAMDSMVLYWSSEALATRIEFWNSGAEFLFIWKKADHSYNICHKVFDLLISINEKQATTNLTAVLTEIKKVSVGHHVFPSDLINRVGGTQENIRDTLIFATKSGIVAPVYRVKTSSFLEEGENEWTTNLGTLNKVFIDEDGNEIDGGDPSNIEVAFLRVAQEEQTL